MTRSASTVVLLKPALLESNASACMLAPAMQATNQAHVTNRFFMKLTCLKTSLYWMKRWRAKMPRNDNGRQALRAAGR
jgi:hypothetical protein